MSTDIARTRADIKKKTEAWRKAGQRIAFVPTMGALHEGHLSLVRLGLEKADKVVASIFVNPAQFAPHEDFASYPRNESLDVELMERTGAHLVYLPTESEIYPGGDKSTAVKPGPAAAGLESDFRPHFFGGVVNVVHRLFAHVEPHMAIFGEKDYQQLCVIREMTEKLRLPIEILGGPIIRDAEGLALSSRNIYLAPEELVIAQLLNKVLFPLAEEIHDFPDEADDLIPVAIQNLLDLGFDDIDYLEVREATTLKPFTTLARPARLLAAAWLGKTRLIDNVEIRPAS